MMRYVPSCLCATCSRIALMSSRVKGERLPFGRLIVAFGSIATFFSRTT